MERTQWGDSQEASSRKLAQTRGAHSRWPEEMQPRGPLETGTSVALLNHVGVLPSWDSERLKTLPKGFQPVGESDVRFRGRWLKTHLDSHEHLVGEQRCVHSAVGI